MRSRYAMICGAGVFLVLAGPIAIDAKPIAIGGIHFYQRTLAPLAARAGVRCRFTPTCSHYADAVIARDGVLRGGWKTVTRIAHCGPWTTAGTVDEP